MGIYLLSIFDSFKLMIIDNTPKAFAIKPSHAVRLQYSPSYGMNNAIIHQINSRENKTSRAYNSFLLLSIKLQFIVQMETVIKKFALIIVAIFFVLYSCETLYAQERNHGYQGSVSYSNMALLWNGIETSHGYMFNEHHYLGFWWNLLFLTLRTKP